MEIPRQKIDQLVELYDEAAEPDDPFGEAQRARRDRFDKAVEKLYEQMKPEGVSLKGFAKKVAAKCAALLHRDKPEQQRKAEDAGRKWQEPPPDPTAPPS